MSIPCQHVDYAVSLLHPSVPKYLFTSSTATDGHCSACNLLDAANLARATLATCDALNIASFRLIYTGKALCSSLPFPCDVHLQCSCRCFFPPAPNVNNPRHLPTSRHPSIFSSPSIHPIFGFFSFLAIFVFRFPSSAVFDNPFCSPVALVYREVEAT